MILFSAWGYFFQISQQLCHNFFLIYFYEGKNRIVFLLLFLLHSLFKENRIAGKRPESDNFG